VMGSIMMVLSFMGFTMPPECAAYWVGEVGQPTLKIATSDSATWPPCIWPKVLHKTSSTTQGF
jgi:hypothetical protein